MCLHSRQNSVTITSVFITIWSLTMLSSKEKAEQKSQEQLPSPRNPFTVYHYSFVVVGVEKKIFNEWPNGSTQIIVPRGNSFQLVLTFLLVRQLYLSLTNVIFSSLSKLIFKWFHKAIEAEFARVSIWW